jgi:nicotinic acid mononucleotide adenylyltransferase
MACLAAEVRALDPHAPPTAHVVLGRARLMRAMRVGVFAGSFNPLTRAHVALAHAARAQYRLDALVWLCAMRTVDKERIERAAWPDRVAQLAARVRSAPPEVLALTNRGLYVEEAAAVRLWLPEGAAIFLLVGFDKIVQIFDARYYEDRESALRELFSLAHLLVAPRLAAGRPEVESLLAQPENRPYAASVGFIELPASHLEDSSTEARTLARHPAANLTWLRELLPPEGVALAAGTSAYAEAGTVAAQPYDLRVRWLDALATVEPARLAQLPALDVLVERSSRPDAQGEALRAWLRRALCQVPTTLPDLPWPPPSGGQT